MAESLNWKIPNDILGHLRSFLPAVDNPLTFFSGLEPFTETTLVVDSDIIREAGIKDALGNLSPAFHRALLVLSDPEACIRVSAPNQFGDFSITFYFGKAFSRSVSVIESNNSILVQDPADFEEIIIHIQDLLGLSSKKFSDFQADFSVEEALIFTMLIDLKRKYALQGLMNNTNIQTHFSIQEILNHYLLGTGNLHWIFNSVKKIDEINLDIFSINKLLQELITKDYCASTQDGFCLKGPAEKVVSDLNFVSKIIDIEAKRLFRNSGRASELTQCCLQSNVNDLLLLNYLKNRIQIEQTSSKQFIENLAFLLHGGITQLPEPLPEFESPGKTFILGMDKIIWQLISLETGKPIQINELIKLGRNPDNQIIFNDPSVSRIHAKIELINNECWITDLNSRNGTYVNNSKIKQPTLLRDKDFIKIGSFNFEVRILPSASLSTQSLPLPQ